MGTAITLSRRTEKSSLAYYVDHPLVSLPKAHEHVPVKISAPNEGLQFQYVAFSVCHC